MLIIGRTINCDLEKARRNLQNYEHLKNPDITFLQAMIEKKEGNYNKTIKLLKRAIKRGCPDAFFEYGKMLYLGEGVEEDKDEAMNYFNQAKEKGCNKIDKFLQKQKQESKKKPKAKTKSKNYDKYIDFVILIDGTISNKFFYEAVKETFSQTAKEYIEENPTIYFRFGAVLYRDLAYSIENNNDKKYYPLFEDLTDDIETIQSFFNKLNTRGGGIKLANDWESGYFAVLNKMSWNDNAEKIVVHLTNVPGHGTNYTMRTEWHKNYFNVPKFHNCTDFQKNFKTYKKFQDRQKGRMYSIIIKLAKKT